MRNNNSTGEEATILPINQMALAHYERILDGHLAYNRTKTRRRCHLLHRSPTSRSSWGITLNNTMRGPFIFLTTISKRVSPSAARRPTRQSLLLIFGPIESLSKRNVRHLQNDNLRLYFDIHQMSAMRLF
jgi:hypothetical protein